MTSTIEAADDGFPPRGLTEAGTPPRVPGDVGGRRPLRGVLREVVAAARRRIPTAVEASITVISGEALVTVEFDGAGAVALDERQYEHGAGPCLDAARDYRPVRLDTLAPDSAAANVYPAFCRAARRSGTDACLALPLGPRDLRPAAALNLYGATAFSLEEQQKAEAFCLRLSVLVLNAARWQDMQTLVAQLQDAVTGRAVIEQAKGMLMLRHGWSPEEAFADLRARSRHGNRTLRDVATETTAELVNSLPFPSMPPSTPPHFVHPNTTTTITVTTTDPNADPTTDPNADPDSDGPTGGQS